MAFQFLCPQGHLLEGDEAHMGMTTQCPHCGMTFIIPTVEVQQPEPEPQVDVYSQPYVPDAAPEETADPEPEPQEEEAPVSSLMDELPAQEGMHEGSLEMPPDVVHIPCPNGHELETPVEMIGQEVLCPHCGVQFRLRQENSVEYRREREIIEQRAARLWFNWAIAAAVLVGILLLAMMIYVATAQ